MPDRIFGQKWNPDLVHQALSVQLANSRQRIAEAKGRGDVSGGGKKPWRQKGTGRSRQGSIRSPIWRGGGVAFGPTKERNFSIKINKKMKKTAIFSVLSRKLKDGEIKVLSALETTDLKTKNIASILKNILSPKSSVLIISSSGNKNIKKAVSNISKVDAISPRSLNVRDLLKYKNIILEKEAIGEIEKHYIKNS